MASPVKALSLLAAIAVASQGAGLDGAVLVCRWTGQVIALEECPTRPAHESRAPSLGTSSCCELRSAPAASPAAPSTPAARSPWGGPAITLALPPGALLPPEAEAVPLATARHHDPPRTPLYLSIRTLLI